MTEPKDNGYQGEFWKSLTEEQKKEVYLSYEESKSDENLTDWEDVKKGEPFNETDS